MGICIATTDHFYQHKPQKVNLGLGHMLSIPPLPQLINTVLIRSWVCCQLKYRNNVPCYGIYIVNFALIELVCWFQFPSLLPQCHDTSWNCFLDKGGILKFWHMHKFYIEFWWLLTSTKVMVEEVISTAPLTLLI